MTIVGIKNSINVLNHIISTCESANVVQSMGQSVAQEAMVPELAQKDMKQPLMTQVPESTKSLKWPSETSQKVTEITPHHKSYSMLEMPIVHLSWNGETPQVTELTRRKIMPLAATPNLCNIFTGRISRFLSNWKALTCDPWVLQTVEKGYVIPLTMTPTQQHHPYSPHLSTREESLLREEIQLLLQKQAVQEVVPNTKGFYSNMFMVPKKDGGQRPVINLKHLNRFVKSEHFKMEGLHTVKALIQENDWMAKIDLKDAFFMVPIAQQHQHLLLFTVGTKTFRFRCLPFGLCTAPRVFTKILKPAIELLRSTGIRLVIYMDDMLIMARSIQLLREHIYQMLYLLENLGFIINSKKSLLSPTQVIEFLGMIVNSQTMEITLPGQKIKTIRLEARQTLNNPQPTAQGISKLLGKLNATTPALQMAPLFCRSIQTCLKHALAPNPLNYQAIVHLSAQAVEDLKWWEQHLLQWNGRSLISPPTTLTISTDASLHGWGAVCNGKKTRGSWSYQERLLHINCLELLAATLGIQTFAKDKSGIMILLKMDNTTAVAYINRRGGTVSPALSDLARDLWLWCTKRNITVQAQHLPGSMNSMADIESRAHPDRSDWKLAPLIFQKIHQLLGPLSVDLFASRLSVQLPLCQLETRPPSHGNRCLLHELDHSPRQDLCQPALGPDRQSPVDSPEPKGPGDGSSGSCLESPSMVPPAFANAGQRTIDHSTLSGDNSVGVPEQSPRHHTTVSLVGYIRSMCASSNLSVSATDLVLSSWRDKSTKSYDSSFGRWTRWCDERDKNPISGPISDIANFLAELYEKDYQYRSINAYRSAISSAHDKVDGYSVGQHPTVCRLMKGIFNKRPPQPRYSFTWDVQKVTSYISAMGDNNALSLKLLSFKLVMLLALTRPSRSNDLSHLDLRFMRSLPEGIQFRPTSLSKQSRPGNPSKPFFFPSFPEDERLCPKQTLLHYISRTESFRSADSNQKNNLFLSYIKPHNPITSSTVARWITALLKLAGIDTDSFKAHSTRSASASAAASAGLTTNQIMDAPDWSSESVFRTFYYKSIQSNQVGVAVLSTKPTDSLQTSR